MQKVCVYSNYFLNEQYAKRVIRGGYFVYVNRAMNFLSFSVRVLKNIYREKSYRINSIKSINPVLQCYMLHNHGSFFSLENMKIKNNKIECVTLYILIVRALLYSTLIVLCEYTRRINILHNSLSAVLAVHIHCIR